jgi:hypothetical protein
MKSDESRRRFALPPSICPSSVLFFSSLSRQEVPGVRLGASFEGFGEGTGDREDVCADVCADDCTGDASFLRQLEPSSHLGAWGAGRLDAAAEFESDIFAYAPKIIC